MINDRVQVLIDSLGVSPNKFSETIDVNPVVIHNIIKARRSKPSYEVLVKILNTCTEVSADWLLRGEGGIWRKRSSMLRTASKNIEQVESRVLDLVEVILEANKDRHEVYELKEMVTLMIDENHSAKRKLLKQKEKQDQVIRTLMKLKRY